MLEEWPSASKRRAVGMGLKLMRGRGSFWDIRVDSHSIVIHCEGTPRYHDSIYITVDTLDRVQFVTQPKVPP
jgi:hypothetical protein